MRGITRHERLMLKLIFSPLSRELDISKSATVATKCHALVLQVTLTTLVTNGAVQRVVYKEKLHYSLPRFSCHVRVGLDTPTFHHRHRTSSNWLEKLT